MNETRGIRKVRKGKVVSNKMNKTIIVEVVRSFRHPQFERVVRRSTRFYAHDEKNECQIGDVVEIVETRPLSKTKRWRLQNIVEKAK